MLRYISQYVSTFNLCLCTKIACYLSLRELYSLLLSNARWETISIDFVMKLPEFMSCKAVVKVIDSVFKRTYFIPTDITVTIEGTTRLFLYNVWKLHGLSTWVVLDRRLQFVACFTKELYHLLEIEIAFYYGLEPTIRWTNRVCQPEVRPISLAVCE